MRTSSTIPSRAPRTWVPLMSSLKWDRFSCSKRRYSMSSVTKARTTRTEERASWATAETRASCSWMACPTTRRRLEARSMTSAARGSTAKVARVSFQFRNRRNPRIPRKVVPCTTRSTSTEETSSWSTVTSLVIRERSSPTRRA